MQEEEDKKKTQEALERKKHFADRFKTRGKRPPPPSESPTSAAANPEIEGSPKKKRKLSSSNVKETKELEDTSAQAEYHRAVESYPSSLQDTGTGVRPFIK
ncbi:hypothetical protein BDZ97DRAFT_1822612 [Flammula alnicola]|nr:hypothetical protein BDZ97DRAFT_1822612 [Flammula alnicola]